MIRGMISLAFLLIFVASAPANDYTQAADGYWYSNGVAYTRSYVAGSSYCSRNGCYYSSPGYYTYAAVPVPAVVQNTTNNYPPLNWRSEVIKTLAAKAEQQAYADTLLATGLAGNAYGVYGSGFGSLQLSTSGVNGSTVYGYQNTLKDLYGDNSANVILQQYLRMTDQARAGFQDAFGQASTIVDAHGERLAKAAQIIATGQVLAQVVAATPPSQTQSTLTVTPGQQSLSAPETLAPPLARPSAADSTAVWTQSAMKCVACHTGPNKKGNFDITTFPSMSQEQRLNVIGRLTTKSDKERMPRNPDGTAGKRMGPEEIRAWLNVGP